MSTDKNYFTDFASFIQERTNSFVGREWVFFQLNKWLANPAESRAFLIVGGPGTGKSAIMARLSQFSQETVETNGYSHLKLGFLSYYHFCQAQQDSTLSPLRFIEALSLALAQRHPSYAKALFEANQGNKQIIINATQAVGTAADGSEVQNVVIQNLNVGNVSARAAFDSTIRLPLETLYREGFKEQITILVDSLDEARTWRSEDNILTVLADTLDDPKDLPAQVRFILTSRPDERVLGIIGLSPSLDLIADAPTNEQEVKKYATFRLMNTILDANISERLCEDLEKASAGNFLYARYVLDDWLTHPTEITEASANNLPNGLKGIYRKFLQRELTRDNEKWEDRYQPLLGLLAVARGKGLSAETLTCASGKEYSEVDNALKACSQYLTDAPRTGPFRIYHQSFRDFLLEDDIYKVYPAQAHQALVDFFTSEYSQRWQTCPDEYALRYTVAHLISLLDYTKLRKRREQQIDVLVTLLTDYCFLEARVRRNWIYEIANEFDTAMLKLPNDHSHFSVLTHLGKILRIDIQFIFDHPEAFFQSCWNLGWWFDSNQAASFYEPPAGGWKVGQAPWDHPGKKLHTLLERWREQRSEIGDTSFWLRALRPLPDPIGNAQMAAYFMQTDPTREVPPDEITAKIDLSPDERKILLFTSEDSTTLKLLESESLTEVDSYTFSNQSEYLLDAVFCPLGDVIAVALADDSIRLFNPDPLKEIGSIFAASGNSDLTTVSLSFSPDGRILISSHENGALVVWDVNRQQKIDVVKSHKAGGKLAFSPNGLEVASTSGRNSEEIRRWQLNSHLKPIEKILVSKNDPWILDTTRTLPWITDLKYSPSGRWLAYALYSKDIVMYDLNSGGIQHFQIGDETFQYMDIFEEHVECLSFTSDQKFLLAGAGDVFHNANVYCWDIEKGHLKWKLNCHRKLVQKILVFKNDRWLLTQGDTTLRLWDLKRMTGGVILNGIEPDIGHAIFSADGLLMFTAGAKSETVRAWRVLDAQLKYAWENNAGGVFSLKTSPDSKWVAYGCGSGVVKVQSLDTGIEQMTFKDHHSPVEALSFSPDGNLLATGARDGTVKLVDLNKREAIWTFTVSNRDWVNIVSFSRDSQLLLAIGLDTFTIWDVKTHEGRSYPKNFTAYFACFADDSRYVVFQGPGRTINTYDLWLYNTVPTDEMHYKSYYGLKMCRPSTNVWEEQRRQANLWEFHNESPWWPLFSADTHKPIAWLPIPDANIIYNPTTDIWALQSGGNLYVYALERT
jgi:WD40 repeat protein